MYISSRHIKVSAAALILAIISIGLLGSMTPVNKYKKFEVDSFNSSEEKVTEECTCYGSLSSMDSYPPQYNCQGYEMCKSVNYTRKGK